MTIIDRLQREAARHPGSTGEGVRIALQVLQECNCGTCRHSREYVMLAFSRCSKLEIDVKPGRFCSEWRARQ